MRESDYFILSYYIDNKKHIETYDIKSSVYDRINTLRLEHSKDLLGIYRVHEFFYHSRTAIEIDTGIL